MNPLSTHIQSLRTPLKRLLVTVSAATFIITATSCTTASSVKAPTGESLKGTWTQTGTGYENGAPVTWENQTVVIDQAHAQGFAGFKEYDKGGQLQKEIVNGVIGLDGNILIVDEDGKFEGRLVKGKLQGQYAEIGDDATAINLELTKK